VTVQRLIQIHRQHLGAKGRDAAREVRIGRGDAIEARSMAAHFENLAGVFE